MIRQKVYSAVAVVLLVAFAVPAGAVDGGKPEPLRIDADSLATLLMTSDPDVVRGMNSVMKARDEINAARSELLPTLNLNFSLLLTNTPAFFVNSVSCLVPFIFPAKWFDLSASKKSYRAEVYALHITRLNAYATAFTIITRMAGDEQTLKIMTEQHDRLGEYVNGLRVQKELGLIPESEVLRGDLSMSMGEQDLSKVRTLIIQEHATLRRMLGLALDRDFVIADMGTMSPSFLESATAIQDLEPVLLRAPEREQIAFAISAAKAKVLSTEWSFLAGCSGSQGGVGTSGVPNALNLSTGLSINIGYGIFPRIKLAKRNVVDMQNRQTELKLELGRVLETTLAEMNEVKGQHAIAIRNQAISEQMYQQQLQLFQLGRAGVKDILESLQGISNARVQQISAVAALASHRITLKRLGLEGEFLDMMVRSRRDLELKKK